MAKSEKDRIYELLEPHHTTFQDIILESWNDNKALPPEFHRKQSQTARAINIHDSIRDKATKHFDLIEGIAPRRCKRMFFLDFDQQCHIRIKKLMNNRLSSNILTKQVEAFREQTLYQLQEQLELPLGARPICLELGYILTPYEDEIAEIWIVKPSTSKSNSWDYRIYKSESVTEANAPIVKTPERDTRKRASDKFKPKTGTSPHLKERAVGDHTDKRGEVIEINRNRKPKS